MGPDCRVLRVWQGCGNFPLRGVKPRPQIWLSSRGCQCQEQLPTYHPAVKGHQDLSAGEKESPLETKPLFFFFLKKGQSTGVFYSQQLTLGSSEGRAVQTGVAQGQTGGVALERAMGKRLQRFLCWVTTLRNHSSHLS